MPLVNRLKGLNWTLADNDGVAVDCFEDKRLTPRGSKAEEIMCLPTHLFLNAGKSVDFLSTTQPWIEGEACVTHHSAAFIRISPKKRVTHMLSSSSFQYLPCIL